MAVIRCGIIKIVILDVLLFVVILITTKKQTNFVKNFVPNLDIMFLKIILYYE